MPVDYRDNDFFGKLDNVLKEFERELTLFRITGKSIGPDGSTIETKKKYTIFGSLQTWRRTRNYSEDGTHTSSRTGKLLVQYQYKLKDGDIIQKNDEYYRIVDTNDFDFAGVHDFAVERIGMDELQRYNFDEYLEEKFVPEITS